MLKSLLIWNLAWKQLKKQKLQTFLSVLGGSIGVILIMISIIFYQSFERSGVSWVNAHFGPIEWELVSEPPNEPLTSEQIAEITNHPGNSSHGFSYLPAIARTSAVLKYEHEPLQTAAGQMLILGFNFNAASGFDPEHDELWHSPLQKDQAIVSVPVAAQLGVSLGDLIGIRDTQQQLMLFKVIKIVEEEGLTGYRGPDLGAGTVIVNESIARLIAGLPDGAYSSVFVSTPKHSSVYTRYPFLFPKVTQMELKEQALQTLRQWKQQFGIVFALMSGFATAAGLLLMRQILLLQADLRQESYAVLRALGLKRRQIRSMFFTEAALLNALSTIAGTVLGSLLGYGVVRLFQWQFAETLYKYASMTIPLMPFFPLREILLAIALIYIGLLLASWLFGWKVSKLKIVETLRAGQGGADSNKNTPARRITSRVLVVISMGIVILHGYQLFNSNNVSLFEANGTSPTIEALSLIIVWFAASIALLCLTFTFSGRIEIILRFVTRRMKIAPVSQMLAFRYPMLKKNRSITVAALFSILFTLLMTIIVFASPMMRYNENHADDQLFHGYPAYISYADKHERSKIAEILHNNELIRKQVHHSLTVEPYRLNIDLPGILTEKATFSIVIPTESYLSRANISLLSRSPEFATDEEAWKAVIEHDDYVILHEKFAYASSEWPGSYTRSGLPIPKLQPGDTIDILVYPQTNLVPPATSYEIIDEPDADIEEIHRRLTEELDEQIRVANQPIAKKTLTIAGFVSMDEGLEFYHSWFVSSEFAEQFREEGFLWPNYPNLGYYLLDISLNDLKSVHQLQEQFIIEGLQTFRIPPLQSMAGYAMDRQVFLIYGAFMIMSVLIGLAGLAIIQYRAVQERGHQLAMLRSMGIGKSTITQLFMLEGVWISWTGIFNGACFGSIGGYLLFHFATRGRPPHLPEIPFLYPWTPVLFVLAAIMLAALLLNIIPARRSNHLSPAEMLRMVD